MMRTIDPETSLLLIIDFQQKLMPAIERGADAVANTARLTNAAALLAVPVLFTEQNTKGLGPTVPELSPHSDAIVHKMSFNAMRAPGFLMRLNELRNDQESRAIVVAGCEAHICVLQTVLGLLDHGLKTYVVRDAIGARRAESKEAAIHRMERHGAEIVTTEMVIFEWLGTAEHPCFRQAMTLVK
jgi:nicotinamidase-related amidase